MFNERSQLYVKNITLILFFCVFGGRGGSGVYFCYPRVLLVVRMALAISLY